MSPAPEIVVPIHPPSPIDVPRPQASVIDISPGLNHGQAPPAGVAENRWEETVVLGQLVAGRERSYPAPPPPRIQHGGWLLSSVLIALGGVVAIVIAGDIGEIPLVGTVALVATVACGALLVAAQVVEEVRRSRNPNDRPSWLGQSGATNRE